MFEIWPEERYPGMYQIRYPDGVLSADFYNYTMAMEHLRLESIRIGPVVAREARGCV